jgi:hypothetical protein
LKSRRFQHREAALAVLVWLEAHAEVDPALAAAIRALLLY